MQLAELLIPVASQSSFLGTTYSEAIFATVPNSLQKPVVNWKYPQMPPDRKHSFLSPYSALEKYEGGIEMPFSFSCRF